MLHECVYIDIDNIHFIDSVNMPDAKTYHRGDLKADLIRAAWEMLEAEGPDGLSVRKLAAAAGVSHNAPYMHFKGRDGLVAALAASGFEGLGQAIRAEVQDFQSDWHDAFRAGCRAYVRYAVANPQLYVLMHRDYCPETWPETVQASVAAFDLLKGALAEGQRQGQIREDDVAEQALGVWAALHGLAGILGRPSGANAVSVNSSDQVVDNTIDMLVTGIALRTKTSSQPALFQAIRLT